MLKKICIYLCITMLIIFPVNVSAEGLKLAPNASSCILIEASTKQVLYANNEKQKLYPASTTKIMTIL